MARFFTSDWHLGSSNINKYAKRPFISAGDAATKLVDGCNETAHWKTDVVFHVGDAWLSGSDRHDSIVDENLLTADFNDYLNFIHASFILLEGNHDKSNVESDLKSMTVDLNQNYRNVTVAHYPSYHEMYRYVGNSNRKTFNGIHVHLCGHVHNSWILHYDKQKNVLNINVGVDCWNYKPVKDTELTELLDFIRDARVKMPKDTLTTDELLQWREMNKKHIEADRKLRKIARYAKKNLTPEECQRRKEAAMKAKGLI